MSSPDPEELVLLHGTPDPLQEHRSLQAGPLTVELDGHAVRGVALGAVELLRGIYPAVRDAEWRTVPLEVALTERAGPQEGFTIEGAGVGKLGPVDVAVAFRISGAVAATLSFEFEATARRPFPYNRIGLNVLHPPGAAGCRFRTDRGTAGVFPAAIEPVRFVDGVFVPMIAPFRGLAVDMPTQTIDLAFSGDEFETEDQRNWTDASYKTYSTPLERGTPEPATAGQRFYQRVVLSLGDRPC
jgi:hypothetical protein